MRQAERNFRRLAVARRSIEPFEVENLYQEELKAFLMVAMDSMERTYCQPGAPFDEARDFDRWMSILKRYWQALKSPEMAGRRARTVLGKLLR